MPSLFALDQTRPLTHADVKGKAGGASEYQFYRLIEHLAKQGTFRSVKCFNTLHERKQLDGVSFFPHAEIVQEVQQEIEQHQEPPIVLVQRFWPNIHGDVAATLARLPRVFLWLHDGDGESMFRFFNQGIPTTDIQAAVNQWSGIAYVPVSNFMREIFQRDPALSCKPMHVIHNALYEDELPRVPEDQRIPRDQRTHLVYASSWHKGAREVAEMFEKLVAKEPRYVLELLSAGYDGNCFDAYKQGLKERLGDRVLIHEPKKREDLAPILANALLVFSAPFRETFGCLFAETVHLGTHVLVEERSGAVAEVVGADHEVVKYKDVDQCQRVIEQIRTCATTPTLADHFKLPFLLQRWTHVLLHQDL